MTRLKLYLNAALSFSFVLTSVGVNARAQQLAANVAPGARGAAGATSRVAPRARRVAVSVADSADGSRFTIVSDAPLDDYSAARDGGRFSVVIPGAEVPALSPNLRGAGVREVQAARKGDELVLSFLLERGARGRAVQKFNRLDVLFEVQEQDAQKKASSGGQSDSTGKEASDTPAPAPSPGAAEAQPAPLEPKPTGGEATPTAAFPAAGATRAARLEALLTPEKRNPVKIARVDTAPVIDGKLDEEMWKSATRFGDFIQTRPGDLIAPSKPTEVLMAYDSKHLYVAFRAFDEPDKVRATVAKRDGIFDDDWVGVILDTFNDGRRAYEFFFNPLGVQADAVMTEGVNEDFSVDVVMESKGLITPEGYVVEVAIPFKSIRYEAGEGKHWRIHLSRSIKRFNDERSNWMPISRDNSSYLGQAGRITGFEGISTERTLEIIPSLTVSQTGNRARPFGFPSVSTGPDGAPDRLLNKPVELDPGLTAKFTITPQITLDFAYNPDFAQVEADATVITANQRFPIFFEEKRPFFLEGKEIFLTPIAAVHTRTIIDPDYAVKLTGKQGRNTFGLLLASDNAPGNLSDEERDFVRDQRNPLSLRAPLLKILDRNATVGILRFKRDVGKENHLGFLATSYNFLDRHNQMGGFDSRFRLNETTTFAAQLLGSVSSQPFFYADEAATIDRQERGVAYFYELDMSARNWGYEYSAVGRSRFFRANLGFNRRFNTNNQSFFVRYNSDPKAKNKLVSWRVHDHFNVSFDWAGRSQGFNNNTQVQLSFQKQSFLGGGIEEGYERLFEEEFGATRDALAGVTARRFGVSAAGLPICDQTGTLPAPDPSNPTLRVPRCTFFGEDPERSSYRKTFYFYGGTTPSKKYSLFFLNVLNYGVFDFDSGAGPRFPRVSPAALNFGQGAPRDPGAANEWRIESNFNYQPSDALRLTASYVKSRLTRRDTDLVAFDDNIYTLRGTYQFTRFIFARARADYTTLRSRVRMQYLLGWTPNPGTAFYAGYNDDLNRNGFNPFTGDLEPGFRRNGRTFFIKMSYLFRRSFGGN